jgi:hypothetical protein
LWAAGSPWWGGAELSVLARGLGEDEWVAADDGDDLGAVADQGGRVLQDVAGQRAAGPAGDGGREGLGALVVRAGPLSARPLAASKACRQVRAGQAWVAVVRSMALLVRV